MWIRKLRCTFEDQRVAPKVDGYESFSYVGSRERIVTILDLMRDIKLYLACLAYDQLRQIVDIVEQRKDDPIFGTL